MLHERAIIIAMSMIVATGCNVIKPDLLDGTADARPDSPKPVDGSIDSPPDAYVPFQGNLATNPDLETGTTTGWTTNGGSAVLALSTAQSHGGTRSLLTGTRQGAWNGPAIPLSTTIRQGRGYTATVWVRMVNAVADNFSVSTRHTCAETGGTERFNVNTTRTPAAGSPTAWSQPSSTFTVVSTAECTVTSFIVYVESSTLEEFYVDDIDIREIQ